MMTNATTEITKDLIETFNDAEINNLRDSLYMSIKKVRGGMTNAAEACGCSSYQLRLVLTGKDSGIEILVKAAVWLRNHQIEQAKKLQSFVTITKEALSMV